MPPYCGWRTKHPGIALDGKTLRGSVGNFCDRAAAQVLSAFATDTALVLAHVDIAEKSNEIPIERDDGAAGDAEFGQQRLRRRRLAEDERGQY